MAYCFQHRSELVVYNELSTVFGDEAPPLRTVQRWSKQFRDDREEVENEERAKTIITETTSVIHGTIQRITSDHLQLKRVTTCYVS